MKKIIMKLTGLKVIVSFIGLFYSVLQVRFFGTSAEMDAFFVAMSAVYMITSLIQGGQLSEVFLPEYLKLKTKFGNEVAHNLLSVILNRMMLIVGIFLVGLFFLSPIVIGLIGPGLNLEFKELSIQLFSFSLVLIFFTLISSFVNTALNAEQIFGRAELTGLINGIVSIVILVLLYERYGVFTLIFALFLGKIIEFIVGLYFLYYLGYKHRLIWSFPEYNVTNFFKVMFNTSGYVGATQIYSVTMTAMASYLPAGSLSIFSYVTQLSTKASNIVMLPISTVFFTKFSSLVSDGKENLVNYLKKPLSYIFIITFIIFCFTSLIGSELLHLLWSEKNLNAKEFEIAYLILCLNFFGFIFSSIGTIYRKSTVALGNSSKLYKAWIIVQLFCSVYSYISIYFFGIFGLASILVLNMILMAIASFYISELSFIKSKDMIYKLILNKKFILFVSNMLLITSFILLLFKSIDLTNIISLILKCSIMCFTTILLLYTFFKSEIKLLLNIYK